MYFAVPVTWTEDRSRTTYENALYSAEVLRDANVDTVILITQARGLPRAIWSFEKAGLHAISWNAPRTEPKTGRLEDFLPSSGAFDESFYALHELIGRVYYGLRY